MTSSDKPEINECVKTMNNLSDDPLQLFLTLLRGIPVPIYIWKRTGGCFILAGHNDAASDITGGLITEYVGKKDEEIHGESPEILDDLRTCYDENKRIVKELEYKFKSTGEKKNLLTTYVPVSSEYIIVHTEDITEKSKVREDLGFRLEFGKLISTISTRLINFKPDEFNLAARRALEEIGRFAGFERCFLVMFRDGAVNPDDFHEWHSDEVSDIRLCSAGMTMANYSWALKKLMRFDKLYIDDINNLPADAEPLKLVMEINSATSLFVIPALCEGKLTGCLGFSLPADRIYFGDDIGALLRMLAESFANAFERKRVEKSLKQAEERFYDLASHSVQGVVVVRDDEPLFVNDRLAEILETEKEDLGKPPMAGYISDLLKGNIGWNSPENPGLKVGAPIFRELQETKIVTCKGNERWVQVIVRDIDYEGSKAIHGIILDISQRKKAELVQNVLYRISETAVMPGSLREMLDRIRAILGDVINVKYLYIALYDPDSDQYHFPYLVDPDLSGVQTKILHKTITDYVRRTEKSLLADHDIFKRLQRERKIRIIKESPRIWMGVPLRTSRAVIGVIAVQSFESQRTYSEADLEFMKIVSGNIAMAIERRRNEEAIRENEAKYRLLFDNAGEAIYIVNRQGIFSMMNGAAAVFLGGKPKDFIGKSLLETLPKEAAESQMALINAVFDTGENQVTDNMLKLRDEEKWFRNSMYPVFDSNEKVSAVHIISHDISSDTMKELRDTARLILLDSLRGAESIDECLTYGCQAVNNAHLFERAVFTIHNENREIVHIGSTGVDDKLVAVARGQMAPDEEMSKYMRQEKFRISGSYFIPREDSAPLRELERYIHQEDQGETAGPLEWKNGDELFVPILMDKGNPSGWLSVDTPHRGKRPNFDTIRFLEEVADIVSQQAREIESREMLIVERKALEEKNIALNTVLSNLAEERESFIRGIAESIDTVLLPALNRCINENGSVNPAYFSYLKNSLMELSNSQGGSQLIFPKLSPREAEICEMIKNGMPTRKIAEALHIKLATVKKHREVIRRKFGLTNNSSNLTTFLNNM